MATPEGAVVETSAAAIGATAVTGEAILAAFCKGATYGNRSAADRDENVSEKLQNKVNDKRAEGVGEGSNSTNPLQNKSPKEIPNMSREQLEKAVPEGWDFQNHNGRIHIKDSNGNFRIRIDPPDKVTNYTHIYVYDEYGNLLDEFGNIVSPKSSLGHLPYNY